MTGRRKPFTKRERHRAAQNGIGYRPGNHWGDGDLPAPYAEGDVLLLPDGAGSDRLCGMAPGHFVVTSAFSIDDGDAWYFRVWDGREEDGGSDRLHAAFAGRSTFDASVDWMAGFELVETADPEGLARREAMIAAGWANPYPPPCPTCGRR